MPYEIRGKCIYKKDGGAKVGCTKGDVHKYMAALHANANESIEVDKEETEQLNEIRKFVRTVLEEDYKTHYEIKELANQALKELAKENVEYVERQSNLATYPDGIKYFLPVRLNNVYHLSPDTYPTLHEFLIKSNVIVNIREAYDENTKGDYLANDEGEYKPGQLRYINLYAESSFSKELAIKARNTTDIGDSLKYADLYFPMFYAFHSTLIHEIQHAYDDFRSNSKIFKSKQSADYKNKYFFAGQEINFHPEKETQKHNAYLIQPHEVWARFTQAMHATNFYDVDFGKDDSKMSYHMVPIEEAIRSFTIHMRGFNLLDKDTQKRLIRKAAQFWGDINEKVKEKNKKLASKKQSVELDEMFIGEDYPANFDMEVFKSLRNFTKRIEYCRNRLQRIAAGSSRIVYKIDDEKVLKLAKNAKGIAQNENEIEKGSDSYFSSLLAKVFDADENGLWVEMELARKVTKGDFKRITGFDINVVGSYLRNFEAENSGRRHLFSIDPEIEAKLDDDEYIQSLREFVAGTDALAADLGEISSYGLVKREGSDSLVLIDFGVTQDIYQKHYSKAPLYEEDEVESNINDNFKNWFAGSKVIDKHGNPIPVHHGTAKKFSKFSFKNSPQQIIWFTSNKGAIEAGEVGAAGKGHIMDLYASIKNPAGWDEYEKYGLGQLESMGYDGAILPDPDGTFTGFVFEPTQLKSVKNKGEWNPGDKSIYKEDTGEVEAKDITLKHDLIVYHGADESNIKSLEKGFNILSPEEKMKLPNTGGGYFGFSASVNIDRAAKYSSVFGSKVVIELKLLKDAKIKGIHNNGKAIDEVLTQEQLEEYSLHGYDAVMELQEGGEEEVRILKSDKVKVIKVISLD